jgi:hypothetical protein
MESTEILARIRGYFESAVSDSAYQKWREEAKLAWDFYDGAQWAPEEVTKLAELGQPAIVINKIAAKIDNVAGTEVAGRTRIAYRSRSGQPEEEQAAKVLSDLLAYTAERTELAQEISRAFRAGLVCGVGWLEVGQTPDVFVQAEDELSVVWDPLARNADLADARFIARERWLDAENVREIFPTHGPTMVAALREEGTLLRSPYAALNGAESVPYFDAKREVYRVVEVQYKQSVRQWRVQLLNGQVQGFYTRPEARDAAKQPGAQLLETLWVPRVHVGYFGGGVLLHHAALEGPDFTLLPYVYKRHKQGGRPYGLVRAAIDPQRELNKRRSKAMHLLNTAQVIADVDAVDDPALLAREAARPDGLILKRAGKDLRIIRNTDLATSQVAVMEQAGRDIQDVLGVFDEAMGKESNAQSGAAIQQRQLASTLNQMFAFDALRRLKKRLGTQLLALLRQTLTPTAVLRITDDLTAARLFAMGEHDLNASFDVVVEEVRDALSLRDAEVITAQRPDLVGA